jgi:hypothetical protein
MRPARLFVPGLAAATLAAAAVPAMAQVAADAPVPSQITTPVPPADPRTLTPTEQKRREALYGTGWQYRMAPISPGANAGTPINPGVEVAPADLSHLDARLKSDEIIMTAMRDSELSRENAVIAAIEPGLPYRTVHREMPDIGRFINFPDFRREIDWFKRRF